MQASRPYCLSCFTTFQQTSLTPLAYISKNLASGFIQQLTLLAGALILFVKKKDGTLRLCVDYKSFNCIITKNQYPLPLLSEALDCLLGTKNYTKIDFQGAFNLIRIKDGDKWKMAFRMSYGHFEYMVMPFGQANALITFQLYINYVMCNYLNVFCITYFDSILIYSYCKADHVVYMSKVLKTILQHWLFGRLDKCEFHMKKVGFVRFIVTPGGITMEPGKKSCIINWPKPKRHQDVQQFPGLANFYC